MAIALQVCLSSELFSLSSLPCCDDDQTEAELLEFEGAVVCAGNRQGGVEPVGRVESFDLLEGLGRGSPTGVLRAWMRSVKT